MPRFVPLRLSKTVIAAALTLAALPALAGDTGGSCRHSGNEIKFVDGVYYTEPNAFDEKKLDRVLAFASIPLDKVAIGRATDKEDAVREQVWDADDGARITLSIDDEDKVWAMSFNAGGTSLSQSGTGVGDLVLTDKTAGNLVGTFKLDDEGDSKKLSCDLRFSLQAGEAAAAAAAAPPPPKGKALPAGGGEIGKVYMTNFNALRKGDADAMIATAAAETRGQMEAARKEPDFAGLLTMLQSFAPTKLAITGGQDFGETAELTLEGSDENGKKVTGTAEMVKEAGVWKVASTSMKSKN